MLAQRESSVSPQPEKCVDEMNIPEGPSPPEKKPRIEMFVSDEKEKIQTPVEIPIQGLQSFISGLHFNSGCTVNFNIHK